MMSSGSGSKIKWDNSNWIDSPSMTEFVRPERILNDKSNK